MAKHHYITVWCCPLCRTRLSDRKIRQDKWRTTFTCYTCCRAWKPEELVGKLQKRKRIQGK